MSIELQRANVYVPSVSNRRVFPKSGTECRYLFGYSFHVSCSQVGERRIIKASECFARVQREDLFNHVLVSILSTQRALRILSYYTLIPQAV